MHGLDHLRDRPEAKEDVLVVDFDTLSVIDAVVSNVGEWGCCLTAADIDELYTNIGIRTGNAGKLIKARVTSIKGRNAAVVFAKSEIAAVNKRAEGRKDISLPVKIADLDGLIEISGTIVDAGNNGCRVSAEGLSALPDEVALTIRKFDRPVLAEFAWRTDTSAGLRLLWDRSLADQNDETLADAAFKAAEQAEGG